MAINRPVRYDRSLHSFPVLFTNNLQDRVQDDFYVYHSVCATKSFCLKLFHMLGYYTNPKSSGLGLDKMIKRSMEESHDSGSNKGISIGVPLACVAFLLIVLVLAKVFYLNHRKIQTIHEIPVLHSPLPEDYSLENACTQYSARTSHTSKISDMQSTLGSATRRISGNANISSSTSDAYPSHKRQSSTQGILVGLLGSPDWEASIQRRLSDHQRRVKRESRHKSTMNSVKRHTWHSERSNATSRYETAHTHLDAGNSDRRKQSLSQQSQKYLQAHDNSRLPYVSSFGELDVLEHRKKRRRTLDVVSKDQRISYKRNRTNQNESLSTTPSGTNLIDSRDSSPNINEDHYSTAREHPLVSSSPRAQDINFHLQVTDYSEFSPEANNDNVSLGSHSAYTEDMNIQSPSINLSQTYNPMNSSAESSFISSWSNLPKFPQPPVTPDFHGPSTPQPPEFTQVNTVQIASPSLGENFYEQFGSFSMNNNFTGFDKKIGLGFMKNNELGTLDGNHNAEANITPESEFGWSSYSENTLSSSGIQHSLIAPLPWMNNNNFALNPFYNPGYGNLSFPFQGPFSVQQPYNNEQSVGVSANPYYDAMNNQENSQIALSKEDQQQPIPEFTRSSRSSFNMNLLNRHHARVLMHVPFSLVPPPPAYLRSSRLIEAASEGESWAIKHLSMSEDTMSARRGLSQSASLTALTLSVPIRPSPLRRVVSMSSASESPVSSCSAHSPNSEWVNRGRDEGRQVIGNLRDRKKSGRMYGEDLSRRYATYESSLFYDPEDEESDDEELVYSQPYNRDKSSCKFKFCVSNPNANNSNIFL